jgi:hypothetical protein
LRVGGLYIIEDVQESYKYYNNGQLRNIGWWYCWQHDILSIGQAGVPPFDYNDSNYVVDKNSTNLKQIIDNIKYEESLKIKLQDLKSPLLWFCEQAQKNDTFCNDFNAAIHSSGYKTKFNDSFNVLVRYVKFFS